MPLPEDQRPILAALVETLIPPANHPAGTADAVRARVEARLDADLAPELPTFQVWLGGLNVECFGVFSSQFPDLYPSIRDELLDRLEADNVRTNWHLEELGTTPTAYLARVIDWVGDAFDAVRAEATPEIHESGH